MPGRQLMCHPLPIARLRARPHGPAVDVGEIHGEAAIPAPAARGLIAGEIAGILDGGAEAGGAHHRAVGAGEAPLGDIVPARMFKIAHQQLLDLAGRHLAPHRGGGPGRDGVGGGDVIVRCRVLRQAGKHGATGLAPRLDEKAMPAIIHDFGQRDVETGIHFRTGVHGDAEAGRARLAAIHRDDERLLAARAVMRIDIGAAEKHLVLDGDGSELAGPHADEGAGFHLLGRCAHRDVVAIPLRFPKVQNGRMQKFFPALRPHGETEQRIVPPTFEAVAPGFLRIGPPLRQIGGRGDVIIDDGAIPDGRPEHAISVPAKGIEQASEFGHGQNGSVLR